jgi:hypothetical protein
MTYNYANVSVFVMPRTRVLEVAVRNQLYHNSNGINYSICYHSYSAVFYKHSISVHVNVIEVIARVCVWVTKIFFRSCSNVRFEVLTAANIKMAVFWPPAPYCLV